jgi:excisionase family DNA binding protein
LCGLFYAQAFVSLSLCVLGMIIINKKKGYDRVKTVSSPDKQRVTEGLWVLLEWLKRGKKLKPYEQAGNNWSSLPEVLQISEIAVLLNISKGKAYSLCKHPDFPAVRIGRRILVRKDQLRTWLDKQIAN